MGTDHHRSNWISRSFTNRNGNLRQKAGQKDRTISASITDITDHHRSNWISKSLSNIDELKDTETSNDNSLYRINVNRSPISAAKDGIKIKKGEISRNRMFFQPVKRISRRVLNKTNASNTNANSIRCNAIAEAKLGHYEKSFKMLKLELDVQRKELGNNNLEEANILCDMVNVLKQSGDSHLNLKFLYEALRIISKENQNFVNDEDLAMIHEKIGDVEAKNGNFVTASHHMCCARDLHHSEERFRKLVYFEKLEHSNYEYVFLCTLCIFFVICVVYFRF